MSEQKGMSASNLELRSRKQPGLQVVCNRSLGTRISIDRIVAADAMPAVPNSRPAVQASANHENFFIGSSLLP